MLDLGFTCLCVYGDQCVIEAEQPAFMQGIWEVIDLLPDPQYRHLGIYIRFGAFPGVLGGRWERFGGFRWLPRKTHEAPGKLLGRSGALGAAPGGFQDAQGRPGKAQTLRLYWFGGFLPGLRLPGNSTAVARPEPTEHTNSTRLLFV